MRKTGRAFALNGGNTDSLITIQLEDGLNEEAIAANVVTTGQVTYKVASNGKIYVYGDAPGQIKLSQFTGKQYIPSEVEEEIEQLPFEVLFEPNVQLGGDRNQIILQQTPTVFTGGLNHLGGNTYLAVWLNPTQLVIDADGTQSIVAFPPTLDPNDFSWIGNGILTAQFYPAKPEENLIVTIEQDSLPLDFVLPHYFVFGELSLQNRTGKTTKTQIDEDYSFTQVEDYTPYRYDPGSNTNSLTPTPTIFDITRICNFTIAFAFETMLYERFSEIDYTKTIDETLSKTVDVLFNGNAFNGDRTETYNETLDYQASASLFSSATDFQCLLISGDPIFGFYNWQEVSPTIAVYSGQTTTIDRDWTREIIEPDWDKPMTLNYFRSQKHLRTEIYTEDTTYTVGAEAWVIPVGAQSNFVVPGNELELITLNITEDRVTPNSLLISGDGLFVIFREQKNILTSNLVSNKDRDIEKYAATNAAGDSYINSHVETTNLTKSNEDEFFININGNIITINTENSWFFSVITNTELDLGIFDLSNDDQSPIYVSKLNYATQYEKVHTLFTNDVFVNQITYNDVEEFQFNYWNTIQFREIYILQGNKRYIGTVLDYTSQDEPDPELTIEIDRSIIEIKVNITGVQDYIIGLAESEEILIFPQNNCSVLLRDRILSDSNKNYCNLVGNLLYFSKSVLDKLSESQQATEVYTINLEVTQDGIETGAFIAVNGAQNVFGISYNPE